MTGFLFQTPHIETASFYRVLQTQDVKSVVSLEPRRSLLRRDSIASAQTAPRVVQQALGRCIYYPCPDRIEMHVVLKRGQSARDRMIANREHLDSGTFSGGGKISFYCQDLFSSWIA
jgi:hypothetical protein